MTDAASTLKKCPFCAEDIKAEAIFCKHCHRDLAAPEPIAAPAQAATTPSGFKWWLWIPLALVGIFIVFAIIGSNDPKAQAKREERDTIALCWSEQQKKSLTPGSQRFIAGACELLERRFKERFGHAP